MTPDLEKRSSHSILAGPEHLENVCSVRRFSTTGPCTLATTEALPYIQLQEVKAALTFLEAPLETTNFVHIRTSTLLKMTQATVQGASPIDSVERHGYLFGHPIAHSMSPLLHQTVYDGLGLKWSQFPLDSLDMDLFLRLREDPRFYGTSLLISTFYEPRVLMFVRRLGNNAPQSCYPKTPGRSYT